MPSSLVDRRVPTQAVTSLRHLLAVAESLGIATEPILSGHHVSRAQVNAFMGRIECERATAVLLDVERQVDPQVSLAMLAVERLDLAHLAFVRPLLTCAVTLRQMFALVNRFSSLISDQLCLEMREDKGQAIFVVGGRRQLRVAPALVEHFMMSVVRACRCLAQREAPVSRVHFGHTTVRPLRLYQSFFGTPAVSFGESDYAIVFPAVYLDLPLGAETEEVRSAAIADAETLAKAASESEPPHAPSIVDEVRAVVSLAETPAQRSIQAVARAMGLSVRTLQRRLADAGTSFDVVVDEALRALAENFVRDLGVRAGVVARRLGFSSHRAFSRAFRRWTSRTPSESRAGSATGSAPSARSPWVRERA